MSEEKQLFNPRFLLGASVRRFKIISDPMVGNVRIQSWTELQRARFEAAMKGKDGKLSVTKSLDTKCRAIVESVVDENGTQVYTNSDIEKLRLQDSRIIDFLCTEICKHVGITEDDFEELEKNSEPTRGADSP